MTKFEYKLLAFLNVMWMIIFPLVISNGIYYLLGSFIAQDLNPYHWWMFTSTFGRVLMVFFEVMILVSIPKWWEQFQN
jgi:hypothetical protein